MKVGCILLLLISISNGCGQEEISTISYEASTRGSYYGLTVTPQEITVFNTRGEKEGTTKVISKENWKKITSLVDEIHLHEIASLKRPSTASYVDGALSANLSITKGGSTYTSSAFDDGNPPQELKKLLDALFSMVSR